MTARTIGFLFTICVVAQSVLAQSTFGSIVGVVEDPGKLVVSGARVTLSSVDDRSTKETVSDENGTFQFLNVKAGRYELLAHADGFGPFKMPSIQLDARQTLRLDIFLKVASATETVEVGDTAPVINTENSSLADTKDFQQVSGLPVNYRGATTSPLAALVTVPGTQQDANGNVSIGGGIPSQVQYSVDGASTVNVRQNGALGNMNPSSELVSEFKVAQFNNNAEFSQLGDVTIATKSGGQNFHGSLFEYLQNSVLDATTLGFDSKPHKAFNTFGGSFSGPVEFPGFSKLKDRTFFFVDFEANRRRYTTPEQWSVPTGDMRAGNLSSFSDPIIDPQTGEPFAGNQIPGDRISSVATNLLQLYVPAPNFGDGSDTNANYRVQSPTPSNTNGYDVRVDHRLTGKQALYMRWSSKHIESTVPNVLLPSDQDDETDRNLILSHNYVIKNNLVNEARVGLSLFRLHVQFPVSGADALQQLGLVGLDISDHPEAQAFPFFDFSDGTGFSVLGRDKAPTTKSKTLQFTDNLSWVKGKHSFKFGVDVRRVSYADVESFGGANDFGAFTFSTGTFTGNAFGDFLLGLPSKSYIAESGPDVLAHTTQTGLYAQDEWRVNNHLTLSFGLRWQALPPFVSPLTNLTAFDKRNGGVIVPDNNQPVPGFLTSINACTGHFNPNPVANPALPCGPVESASSMDLGPGVRQFYKKNFQPRFGFAYRPFGDDKTVVRGGFGIFTMTNLGQLSFNTTNISVATVRTTVNQDPATGQPTYQFPNVRTLDNPLTIAGTGDFYQNVATDYRDPQSAQWNLTVERELVRDTALRVSYVGTNSYRMSQSVDLNQVHAGTSPYDPSQRPYLNWGRILSSENQGSVNYEALQSELNHRTHGLTLQASHVWAKSLGNVGGDAPGAFTPEIIYGTPVADRFDLRANRGDIAAVRRHRVLVSAIYDLPVGRDRKFFHQANRLVDGLIGGWSLSAITMWQTGPYLTPTVSPSIDPANLGLVFRGASLRPDCVGNGNISNPTPDHYFDINAFAEPPADSGRMGNCGVGILQGPGTVAIAGGLSKTFALGERVRLKFESTFTNLPNHLNYVPPAVNVSSPATFGKTTSVQTAENAGNRTGQIALRIEF